MHDYLWAFNCLLLQNLFKNIKTNWKSKYTEIVVESSERIGETRENILVRIKWKITNEWTIAITSNEPWRFSETAISSIYCRRRSCKSDLRKRKIAWWSNIYRWGCWIKTNWCSSGICTACYRIKDIWSKGTLILGQ